MKTVIFAVLFTLVALCYSIAETHHVELKLEPEVDHASWCDKFPCYTAPRKQWVSQKYLTKRRNYEK